MPQGPIMPYSSRFWMIYDIHWYSLYLQKATVLSSYGKLPKAHLEWREKNSAIGDLLDALALGVHLPREMVQRISKATGSTSHRHSSWHFLAFFVAKSWNPTSTHGKWLKMAQNRENHLDIIDTLWFQGTSHATCGVHQQPAAMAHLSFVERLLIPRSLKFNMDQVDESTLGIFSSSM